MPTLRPEAFDWRRETPKDWAQAGVWHGEVSSAMGIRPLGEQELAAQEEKFAALAAKVPRMRDFLDHHRSSRRHLAAQVLKP